MTRAWKGKPALRIPVLPESISVKSMADLSNNEQGIAVGLDAESIEAVHVMPGETTAMAVTGRVGCGKSAMLRRIGKMVLEVNGNTLLYCLDSERKSLANLQEKGTAYAQLSETEKVQDLFSQIFKELTDRMRKRKEAAAEITEEPWMILLIDDIKECSKLPDDIQLQLHRIMTKTKGYGVLVRRISLVWTSNLPVLLLLCQIRQCIMKAFIRIILRKAKEMQSWKKALESFLQAMAARRSSA